MKLVTFEAAGAGLEAGVLADGRIVPLRELAMAANTGGPVAGDVRTFLELEPGFQRQLADLAAGWEGDAVDCSTARLGPPVPDPQKILCIGLNYVDHAAETEMEPPSSPIVFAKFANSLVGPTDDIVVPPLGSSVDYEAELAVVIGSRCARVETGRALDHVFGAMAFNDVSARDLQMETSQWTMGKAIDTFGPCGPALVSLDEIGDLQSLSIRATVNGETMQDGNTSAMIFSVAETIAYLSSVMTLLPGDIIATGTPAGVGMGRNPPVTLDDGDIVEVEIETVGRLRNRVVEEAPVTAPAAALGGR